MRIRPTGRRPPRGQLTGRQGPAVLGGPRPARLPTSLPPTRTGCSPTAPGRAAVAKGSRGPGWGARRRLAGGSGRRPSQRDFGRRALVKP